jgi:hypothetical protein
MRGENEAAYAAALQRQWAAGDAHNAARQRVRKLQEEEVFATQRLRRTGFSDAADMLNETRRELARARETEATTKVAYEEAQAAATALAAKCPRGVKVRHPLARSRNRTVGLG